MTRLLPVLAALALLSGPASAQSSLSLGQIDVDPTAPVEITADSLSVDRETGRATFTGNVRVGQGELRLAAANVDVLYDEATGEVAELDASGGVTFATATEAAESDAAVYDIASGLLTLTGDVLLTQGPNALSSDRMVIDLASGTAELTGGVRTVFGGQGSGAQ
ncbi:LptA/OstA family protein [Wenxinia saemankumensis]|uniref:Lipopolysaccharide export system protein LptA n=1 Tax=Wenxinia saemankumensis TaxID=1447782 RepID=A0A1M6FS38_9RHOB|nr:LptA/OstA family protein [Wenxinia saemankumensis]SHJ00521.1 lipopolysaccharide export system protein LptA [Wenxinia saemankumensis]